MKRIWLAVGLTAMLGAGVAGAEDSGTRVAIRLAQSAGEMPDTERLVAVLEAAGGDHQVMAKRRVADGQDQLDLDLWGATLPASEIPSALRAAFPVLATAQIEVSALDPSARPAFEPLDGSVPDGGVRVVKKIIKTIQQ